MADLNSVADALEELGASVNRKTFASKMTDPNFAESVRQSLAKGDATVSDSATFYNTYGKSQPPNPAYDDQLNDLYANAKKVGYSGLDRDQKALFDQQYQYSQAAKDGMSLADVIRATDFGGGTVGKVLGKAQGLAGDAYQAARVVVSGPIAEAALGGSFVKNTLGDMVSHDKPVDLGQNLWDAANYAQKVYDKAAQGEGIPGMLSDPINLVPVGGAADVAKGLAKVGLPAAGKFIMDSWIPRAIVGGVTAAGENAGLTTLGNKIDPNRKSSLPQSAGIGFAAGALGSALPASHFVSKLPGVTTLVNRADGPAEKQRILDAATDMYNKSTFLGLGGGQGSYQRVANQAGNASTKLYDKLRSTIGEPGPADWAPELRNATNISGQPVSNPGLIVEGSLLGSVPATRYAPIPSADAKAEMLESLNRQNASDKAGFTKAQLAKAVDSYIDRVKAVIPDEADLGADKFVEPNKIFDSKVWLNSDIYNARQEPGAGAKAKLAQMLHTAVNERIGGMTDKAGKTQKNLASKAGKAYADYVLKQRIVDQGVKSASGRHGGSFWVPTAFGKGIQLGTGIGAKLSR